MPNFAASIIARLGLDTEGFRSELSSAASAADSAHDRLSRSADRSTDAHERLLASNHRVARQVQNFSRDLLSGADASTVFATGLEGLGRSLNVSLGALAGIAIGVTAVTKIHEIVAELEKLHQEAEKIGETTINPFTETLSELQEFEKKAHGTAEKIKEEQAGTWNFVKRLIADTYNSLPPFVRTGEDVGKPKQTTGDRLADDLKKTETQEAEAKRAESVKKLLLKLQVSSKELIAEGPTFSDQNKASLEAINNAEFARKAAELRAQAHDIILRNPENVRGAGELINRADQLTSGISTLKDNEKELTSAIDASSVLRALEAGQRELNQNVKQINFGNL